MDILIATPLPTVGLRQSRRLSADGRFNVSHVVKNLTEAYHASEHDQPAAAIVDASLAAAPEFEVLLLLFRALGIGCLIVDESRQPGQRGGSPARAPLDAIPDLLEGTIRAARSRATHRSPRSSAVPVSAGPDARNRLILIGASTGGVDALISVLSAFNANCPPTLIVQHTGGAFTPGLARLLDGAVAPQVAEATDGCLLRPGQVLLAPGSRHLEVGERGRICRLRDGPPISGHRPSVDALFRSGVPVANRMAAAILTGMGRDGADGLLELRRAGAQTFGQDEATSIIYGMPRVAQEIGAVDRQLPVEEIGRALIIASRVTA